LADFFQSLQTPKEQEQAPEFPWDAFQTNYRHGKYRLRSWLYHMPTMSFIYFNIWQIK